MIEIDWQDKAEKLWSLLDDIDTASDMFHPSGEKSYKAFYEYAMKKCEERGKYMNSLDGQTLTAVEQEEYNKQVKERYNLLDQWGHLVDITDIISQKSRQLSEPEKSNYLFKWDQLVPQEINMWIQINKKVTKKEFDDMCAVRGFDDQMTNYLKNALKVVNLWSE